MKTGRGRKSQKKIINKGKFGQQNFFFYLHFCRISICELPSHLVEKQGRYHAFWNLPVPNQSVEAESQEIKKFFRHLWKIIPVNEK